MTAARKKSIEIRAVEPEQVAGGVGDGGSHDEQPDEIGKAQPVPQMGRGWRGLGRRNL